MNHNVTLSAFGCTLRPVRIDDAEFIVKLRNQDYVQKAVHHTSASIEAQIMWITDYLKRHDDYYWIIEGQGDPVGTIGLYDITVDRMEAMPGRWVMYPQNKISIMAPIYLTYKFAFEDLGIDRFVMDVSANNKKVRKFHELYGAWLISEPERYRGTSEEVGRDMVWYGFDKSKWPGFKKYWEEILSNC